MRLICASESGFSGVTGLQWVVLKPFASEDHSGRDEDVDHSGEVLRRVTEAVFPGGDRPAVTPVNLVRRLP